MTGFKIVLVWQILKTLSAIGEDCSVLPIPEATPGPTREETSSVAFLILILVARGIGRDWLLALLMSRIDKQSAYSYPVLETQVGISATWEQKSLS